MRGKAPELTSLPMRLQNLGFVRDPFGYPEAEKMPNERDLWERLFVEHPGFDEIQDLERSAVLLAGRGGGKTAHRLYFSIMLSRNHPNLIFINYESFAPLAEKLPNIRTSDHFCTLMASIAEALLDYVRKPANKEFFLEKQSLADREWFWTFLNSYLATNLQHELDSDLRADFEAIEVSALLPPVQRNTPLPMAIKNICEHLSSFGITRVFVLVDGVDGTHEFNELNSMAALVMPLLNGLTLLSTKDLVWKFFLPRSLQQFVMSSSGYQTARVDLVPIEWNHESLVKFLNFRLNWASDGLYQKAEDLCSQELSKQIDIEVELTKMAMRHRYLDPPRALLNLLRQLFRSNEE